MANLTTTTELLEAWGDIVPFTDFPNQDWPESGRPVISPITSISHREVR